MPAFPNTIVFGTAAIARFGTKAARPQFTKLGHWRLVTDVCFQDCGQVYPMTEIGA